jgi:N-acetylglucosamine-6-phosphate deacetylase
MKRKLISKGFVFNKNEGFEKKDILIEGNKIIKIEESVTTDPTDLEFTDADGYYVVPGFIDIHTHGACGCDFMHSTEEDINSLSLFFASKGVTSFLPAIMTASMEDIYCALGNIRNAIKAGTSGAKILGINLEGPFINPEFKGAHPTEHITVPTPALLNNLMERSGNNIKLITVAPEISGGMEIPEYLKEYGIKFSIGHSGLDYKSSVRAFKSGFEHITHLFNAMEGLHHRKPGLVGAALDDDRITVEIIADGIHIDPAVIRIILKCKTTHNVVLITDSISGTGLAVDWYTLGGQKIHVEKGVARLENGVLAGSTLTMVDSVRKMVREFNVPLEDAVRMAAVNPARVLNIHKRKGSLEEEMDADLTILDKDLNVLMTFAEGRIVYKNR